MARQRGGATEALQMRLAPNVIADSLPCVAHCLPTP